MQTRQYSSISQDTTLSSGGINASATSMVVATGTGSGLLGGVVLTTGDTFQVAIDPDTVNEELVYITGSSGDTFTIVRAVAGTSAVAHADGAIVRHVLSSDDLNWFNTTSPGTLSTAKGDIIVANGEQAVSRFAVGTDGYVLTADSTQTLGVKWTTTGTGDVTLNGVQTLTNKTLTAPVVNLAINAKTGITTYTPVLTDNGKLVTLSNTSSITFTVPTNASVAFPVGAQLNIQQVNTGQVTVAGAGGVTINGTGTKLRTRWSAATLVQTSSNVWTLIGDIV